MLVCGRSVFRIRVEIHEIDRVIRERGSPGQSTDFSCFLIELPGLSVFHQVSFEV